MSERTYDQSLIDRLRDMEARLRAVERSFVIASELSTESVLLRTRNGSAKYRIQPGTNPGTIEIYNVNGGIVRRVITVP